jgi:membrane protease YdiL (CAAX protease family)
VITEESSPQSAPLDEAQTAVPDPNLVEGLQPTPGPTTPAPRSPWWEVLRAGLVWVLSVILLLFLPLIVAIPYVVYRLTLAGPVTQEAFIKDPMLIFFSAVGIIPAHLLTLAAGWWYVTRGGRYPFWKTIGFEWPPNTSPAIGTALCFLLALVLLSVAWLLTNFFGGEKTELDLLIESSLPARFLLAFAAVATAPLVEELIYRGVVYSAIERAAGIPIAIFAVSLLFAGVHVWQYRNNVAVITVITLLSFTLTITRALTGKLMPAFIIHLIFNGIQSVLIVLGAFVDHDVLK